MPPIKKTFINFDVQFLRLPLFYNATIVISAFIFASVYALPSLADTSKQLQTKVTVVCIEGITGPSTRAGFNDCFEPSGLELKGVRATDMKSTAVDNKLAMAVGIDQAELFRRHLASGAPQTAEVRVCIINGANICFEGPMEIVWVCITTGMLAGSTCPTPWDANKPAAVVGLATPKQG